MLKKIDRKNVTLLMVQFQLDADGVTQYREDLQELVENRKPLITMLSQGMDLYVYSTDI